MGAVSEMPGRSPGLAASRPKGLGLVIAVRNEARWLDALFQSLRDQEGIDGVRCIAVVDGRSEDNSREIIAGWTSRLPAVRLLDNPARIAPVAFNIGIRACLEAGAETVVLVSAHSALHDGFLSQLNAILERTDAGIVGCIHDFPPAADAFERASQAFAESRLGRRLGDFSRLTGLEETPIAFCPAIRRAVFERIGFYDETMVRNQDIEFTTRARAAGFRIMTSPRLKTRYAPPNSWGRLVRQMYGNGVWVGRRLSAHGLRHLAPALFFGALLACAIAAAVVGPPWAAITGALGGVYLLAVAAATLVWLPKAGGAALWLPLMFVGSHAAYAAGTFRGLVSREGPRAPSPSGGTP